MQYLITFLEGIISFISPCMLPLLPVYVSYFAGGADKKSNPLPSALSFVLGFTAVFCSFGVFAGTLGGFLARYETAVNVVCGLIIILLGLSFLNIIHLPHLQITHSGPEIKGVFSAFIFGVVFSVSHTPCVGAFLGSALMMASASGTLAKGVLLLLAYSLGLGIPFVISALILGRLTVLFAWIKKHYGVINTVCGVFLVIIGLLMMFGIMHRIQHLLG